MHKSLKALSAFALCSTLFFSCGESSGPIYRTQGPFQYRFLSSTKVEIIYENQQFLIDRYAQQRSNFPFNYNFEDDGDLDIFAFNREIELDSPYDRDNRRVGYSNHSSRPTKPVVKVQSTQNVKAKTTSSKTSTTTVKTTSTVKPTVKSIKTTSTSSTSTKTSTRSPKNRTKSFTTKKKSTSTTTKK